MRGCVQVRFSAVEIALTLRFRRVLAQASWLRWRGRGSRRSYKVFAGLAVKLASAQR